MRQKIDTGSRWTIVLRGLLAKLYRPAKNRVVICVGLVALGCIAFWFFRPSPGYDITRVEPRLSSLQEPYQRIKTALYLDGGSVGIEITDRDGKTEQFAIPSRLEETNRYTKVYVGAMYDSKPGAVLVSDSEQTKRMLIHVLAAMPNRKPDDDACLIMLRHRPADIVHLYFLHFTGAFKGHP